MSEAVAEDQEMKNSSVRASVTSMTETGLGDQPTACPWVSF